MTTKNKNLQVVDLEELVQEKLSQQILNNLQYVRIEISEEPEPGFSLKIHEKNVEFRFVLRTTTKKVMTWFGGLTAAFGGALALLKWLLPILATYLIKPPP